MLHRTINCARKGCYAIITLHPDDERRLRRTHEEFWCPAGHSNYFPDKTAEEEEIERLERRAEHNEEWAIREQETADRLRALAGAMQVCPTGCGWRGRRRLPWAATEEDIARFTDRVYADLREHLCAQHDVLIGEAEGCDTFGAEARV